VIKREFVYPVSEEKPVVLSKGVLNKLRRLQFFVTKLFSVFYKTLPYVAMLGADENGVVQHIEPIIRCKMHKKVYECYFTPIITRQQMTDATVNIVKRKLTPCGILRMGGRFYESGHLILGTPSEDFTRLFDYHKNPNFNSYVVGKKGMSVSNVVYNNNKSRKSGIKKSIHLGWKTLTEGKS
jgi:hypothetical protein